MCSVVFLVNLARVVFAPLLEPLSAAFGLTESTAGLIATLAWLGSATPRIPTGYLLTRVDRHKVVLATGAVLTGAAAFMTVADSVVMLGAGAFLMGVASGAYFIAANPLVTELFPERVGRAIGIHGTASQLAAVAAPVFVGAVLVAATWREVFTVIAVVAAGATAVFYWTARRTEMPDAGTEDRDLLTAARRQWPIILAGIAILGATGFVWNGLFNFYVKYVTATKGVNAGTARNLLTVVFAAGVPAFWVTGRLADRLPHVPLMLAILGGFVATLFALTAAQGLAVLAAVTAVMGYVIHSLFPALDTYLLDSLPDENRASAYSLYSGAMMIVQAMGSVVIGALLDAGFGYDAVFRAFGGGLVAILAVLVVLWSADRLPTGGQDPTVVRGD
ncbi:MFS transporter [Halorussus caseinilyticus]|uniref:MFS transporter n=1 Tax=Halorussus caseinilyticus TaxID=3034025 RepID=A0ABD5WKF0_9EURY|nr:MFS transporter [Halorussus sp. DT72]